MQDHVLVWVIGGAAVITKIGGVVLNSILASQVPGTPELTPLRTVLFVTVAFQLISLFSTIYFSTRLPRVLARPVAEPRKSTWRTFAVGVSITTLALVLAGTSLIWLTTETNSLPETLLHQPPTVLLAIWFVFWGFAILSYLALFTVLGLWVKKSLRAQSAGRRDLGFGARAPEMREIPGSRRSFGSRDTTLASPPRTPTSTRAGSSLRYSSSTRAGTMSSKTRVIRPSSRSSLEPLPFPIPPRDETSLESAFDQWDTSSVHREMRNTVLASSPPPTAMGAASRPGLEPIPGSRPESPADALNGPFLPSSSPIAISSDDAVAIDNFTPSPRAAVPSSSPPSSPPNFSRPTSKRETRAFTAPAPAPDPVAAPMFAPLLVPTPPGLSASVSMPELTSSVSMQELIHPLFRSDSPHPPPIATSGTMVTASPMADHLITPKILARLRSHSDLRRRDGALAGTGTGMGSWKAMSGIDTRTSAVRENQQARTVSRSQSQTNIHSQPQPQPQVRMRSHSNTQRMRSERGRQRPSTADSVTSVNSFPTDVGSPGPSIVDEDDDERSREVEVEEAELPPILPGFVMSAGHRSSLIGYGKRKSVKKTANAQNTPYF